MRLNSMTLRSARPAARDGRTGTEPLPESALPESDWHLVCRVRQGDAAAFEAILRRHNRRLYRIARGILRNPSDAEDVVQETYCRAYARLDSFIGPAGFSAWLAKIAANEALDRVRRRGRVVSFSAYTKGPEADATPDPGESLPADQPSPERLAMSGELRGLIERAVDDLPADFRAVFMLRAVEGMTVAETADCLSIAPETVKTRYFRARRQLRAALGQAMEDSLLSSFEFAGVRCDRIVATVFARLGITLPQHRSN